MKHLLYTLFIGVFILSCGTENKPIYNFVATASPSEGGTIEPSFGQYSEGKSLEVRAIPTEGWEFVRWEGDLTQSLNPIRIKINKEYNVIGVFQRLTFGVNITIQGEGTVLERIVSSPRKTMYPYETVVELKARPNNGWVFYKWSGDLTGNSNPITTKVENETTVTSIFKSIDELLNIDTTGRGSVSISQSTFASNPSRNVLTLTARPAIIANEIWEFSGWGGDATGTDNPVTIEITEEKNVTASFDLIIKWSEGEVYNPATGRVWMDRDLGASRVATSSTDTQAFGDLYQWGRGNDGHQKRNSSTTSTLSSTDHPSHGSFILSSSDWRSPQNNNLWQGVNGVNNPCPSGFRIPTDVEWNLERASWSSNNAAGAFASHLKLVRAGDRRRNGSLTLVGVNGYYWSSTISGGNAMNLYFDNVSSGTYSQHRAKGNPIRCIKD